MPFSSIAVMLPIDKGTRVEDATSIIVWCLGVETDSEEPLGVSDSTHSSSFLPLEGRCYQHTSAADSPVTPFQALALALGLLTWWFSPGNTGAGYFHPLFLGFIEWELCEPSVMFLCSRFLDGGHRCI